MSKVVSALSIGLALASGQAQAQEIGMVTLPANRESGELIVDVPTRPDGETVYILRDNKVVAEAKVKSAPGMAGTILNLAPTDAAQVRVGDRISLSSSLTKVLPKSAYDAASRGDLAVHPGAKILSANAPANRVTVEQTSVTSLDGPPASAAPLVGPAPIVPAPVPTPLGTLPGLSAASTTIETKRTTVETKVGQLEKGGMSSYGAGSSAAAALPIAPALTPRGMEIPFYPAPAVTVTSKHEAGIMGPYGQGLAAAAPVGTPYLRSPAFAGPPIIYMPQTVTRVLLPGQTPAAYDVMHPPVNYAYSSAPFLRTDIYTSLPYGTFYWPQGYAGTTPVEPQVPAYVLAPSTAVYSETASYAVQRYDPAVANPETIEPITAGITSTDLSVAAATADAAAPLVTVPGASFSTSALPLPGGTATATESVTTVFDGAPAALPALDGATAWSVVPGSTTAAPAPALPSSMITTQVTTVPALAPLPLTPDTGIVAPPPLGSTLPALPESSTLPALPGTSVAPVPPAPGSALPALPGTTSVLPSLPGSTVTPSGMAPSLSPLPSLPVAATTTIGALPEASAPIIVDNAQAGYLLLEPADAFEQSGNISDSYNENSLSAKVDTTPKKVTFLADVPADGNYDVSLWWVVSGDTFRATSIPVTVMATDGPKPLTINQADRAGNRAWTSLGTFALKAGQKVPVLTISTEGVTPGPTISLSVDAMRLVKQ